MTQKSKLIAFVLCGIGLLVLPLILQQFGNAWVRIADIALLYVMLALGLNIVVGYAGLLEQKVEESGKELQCIKTTLLASMQGYNPATAIEFGRKVLYSTERPSFSELESHVKGKK